MSKKVQGGFDKTSQNLRAQVAKAESAVRKAKTPAEKKAALIKLSNWRKLMERHAMESNRVRTQKKSK